MHRLAPRVGSTTFPAMGCTARVTIVDGDESLLRVAQRRIQQLEQRWSRFIDTSDLSRLNQSHGDAVKVSSDTILLVAHLIEAHRTTQGAFDPTVLRTLVELGDDTSLVDDSNVTKFDRCVPASHDLDAIAIDTRTNSISLPLGLCLDAGGIGKGLASDIVAGELMAMGARGVCVNLGGDLRCIGDAGDPRGWVVEIMDANVHDVAVGCVAIAEGAVATSTTRARRWVAGTTEQHHIIDPRTMSPTAQDPHSLQLVTVVAASAGWAEAFTKTILVLGWTLGQQLATRYGMAAFAVDNSGRHFMNDEWRKVAR